MGFTVKPSIRGVGKAQNLSWLLSRFPHMGLAGEVSRATSLLTRGANSIPLRAE